MRALRLLVWAYGIAGALSLLVIPIYAKGWFGLEPDPLAAVFAVVLAMPWLWLLSSLLPGASSWVGAISLGGGIGLNLMLGIWLLRWLGRRAQRQRAGRADHT